MDMENETKTKSNPISEVKTIEVKNVKTFRAHDGQGLDATVYVNGIKTCKVLDDGWGGGFQYDVINNEMFEKLKVHVKSLPPIDMTQFGGINDQMETTMDIVIDEVCKKYLDTKFLNNLLKKQTNTIFWGLPTKKGTYTYVKYNTPLSQVPTTQLQKDIDGFKNKMKPNHVFWNTNLTELGITL